MSNPRRGLPPGPDADGKRSMPARAADAGSSMFDKLPRWSALSAKLPRWSPEVGRRVVKVAVPAVAALALTGTVAGGTAIRSAQSAQPAPAATVETIRPADAAATAPGTTPSETSPPAAPKSDLPSQSGPPAVEPKIAPEPTPDRTSKAPDPTKAEPTRPESGAKGVGKRYATVVVNVRSDATTESDTVGSLDVAEEVTITANTRNGFQQVLFGDRPRWVKSEYLSEQKPSPSERTRSSSPSEGSPDGSGSSEEGSSGDSDSDSRGTGGSCNRDLGSKSGLSSSARRTWDAICANFPDVKTIGGTRGGSGSYHNEGRALDVMITGERGKEVARWARANASELGVTEVIHARQIWTTQRSGEGWRGMEDRGGTTANHYDHVHISTK